MAQENPFVGFIKRYQGKPVLFAKEVLGIDLDPPQREILEKICVRKVRRLSVRSGHGVGKTTTMAVAMIYTLIFESYRGSVKCVCTAPAASTLFDNLMAECKTRINKLPSGVKELFYPTSTHIRFQPDPEGAFISARTSSADKPEALAGIHADRVLIVVDEASGVPDAVFNAARGSMSTPNATTCLIGNPTRNTGYFFRTHHDLSSMWETMKVSSENSIRVDADFIEEVLKNSHGDKDHNEYRIRVRGEFPLDDGYSFIARHLATRAQELRYSPGRTAVWGVDVARSGKDASALAIRRGSVVSDVATWSKKSTMETANLVKMMYDETPDDEKPAIICVDSNGIGAGVLDRLVELELPAVGVNVSETSDLASRGTRLRDDLWCVLNDILENSGLQLPDDSELVDEITSPMVKLYDSQGRITIESKQDMKKRLGRSPDRADAVMLTLTSRAIRESPLNATSGSTGAMAKLAGRKRRPLHRNLHTTL